MGRSGGAATPHYSRGLKVEIHSSLNKMLVASGLIHVQEIPDYRIDNIHASLLHAVAVELLEEDAFFDKALAD